MPVVLVVGSGYRAFREYLLAGVAKRATVVLVDTGTVDWQRPYLFDSRTVPAGDRPALLAAVAELASVQPIDGVLTWDERSVVVAAEAAEAIGVPSMPVGAARACRDKARQRDLLAAAGVPSARFQLVTTVEQARSAAEALGYPVVVKPRSRAASVGVRRVANPAELMAAVTETLAADATTPAGYGGFGGGLLIEELLSGTEISVDSWVLDGDVTPFVVAHKRLGFPPYFVETGHVVGAPLPEALWRRVREVVTAANRALGTDRCVTHTELMLTVDGPRIVEVNGRLGGDLIPYLGELTTPGLSAGGIAAMVATGTRPGAVPHPTRLAGIGFTYPRFDLRFDHLAVPVGLRAQPWLVELVELGSAGQQMRLPPAAFLDRAGYCIVCGSDPATVAQRLDLVAAQVVASGAPLTG